LIAARFRQAAVFELLGVPRFLPELRGVAS